MIKQSFNRSEQTCRIDTIDEDKIRALRPRLDSLPQISDLFRALADETRARIVYCLAQEELCVCDLAVLFDLSRPAVSHHLRILRDLKLVRSRREGKFVYYTIDDEHVRHLITETVAHLQEAHEL